MSQLGKIFLWIALVGVLASIGAGYFVSVKWDETRTNLTSEQTAHASATAEAKKQNIPHRVYKFSFEEMDRARADGDTQGFAKIITDPKGMILGAAIAGPHAGELIHEYVLAMAKRMTTNDLSGIIHVYPTLAQINRRVADQRRKESLTPTAKKWIMRIAGLRGA